jgi:UDP-N-acetylmuramoyl-L-alanyl-D-glutamate--2,6-diaminopimelate ligase
MKAMQKDLTHILREVDTAEWKGPEEVAVREVTIDSRECISGSLFVAIRGTQTDGHTFIDKAIEKGAVAVIAESLPPVLHPGVSYVRVADSRAALGLVADSFFDSPSQQVRLVGVTGTNGKTTTATLLFRLLQALGYSCGLISTVENRIGETMLTATHTTPDAVSLNRLLRKMADAGCTYVFMEVSSHALDQKRVCGIRFAGGVFTNISHDHLDYHKTFQNYIFAKKKLFDGLPPEAFALVNKDDRRWEVMLQNSKARHATYALHGMADFRGRVIENDLHGLVMDLDGQTLASRLIGTFNASNLLAAYAVASLLGLDSNEVLPALSQLETAPGRFQQLPSGKPEVSGIIDYAHTPDALEKVLETIHQINVARRPVFTVVGCGGDRDRQKRPLMGKIACELSDQAILTADNPRSEDPDEIIEEMMSGIPSESASKVLVITDRRQAIRTAVRLAAGGGLVLVAGKGHETTQEIRGERFEFDDRKELALAFQELYDN